MPTNTGCTIQEILGSDNPNQGRIKINKNFDCVFSAITNTIANDTYVTGGTYNSLTENIDFSGTTLFPNFSVNVSALLDDTNTFTTGATLNGTILEFDRNDLLSAYTVDLNPALSGFVSTSYWVSGSTGNFSVKAINDSGIDATGDYSHAIGSDTLASGDYSHAEGLDTTASGYGSHAEGQLTLASGAYSHAQGEETIASGITSHAEGFQTIAGGTSSHAEGQLTLASGAYSHAQGEETIASGIASHAEGSQTTASGNQSHTEGDRTTASGISSHAEGSATLASGNLSHAEGFETTASGEMSHAEGDSTTASGDLGSHSEGHLTTASGVRSHAEGASTTASGDASHAEGRSTTASGLYSHSEGFDTLASGDYSHAQGGETIASGNRSHAEGSNTIASGSQSHAEGFNTIASGISSHAEGATTIAGGDASHAEGSHTIANGNRSHAGGRGFNASNSVISSGDTSFAHFRINSTLGNLGAYGNHSAILGGLNHNIGTLAHQSAILGGNANIINTSVINSVILGGANITATTSNTVYVPTLNINITPTNNNTLTQILARDTDGTIKYKDISSFTDLVVTGGTYDGNTGIATFANNSGGTFQISGFLTGMTDFHTTGATLVGSTVVFDRNDTLSAYTVDLSSLQFTGQTLEQTLTLGNATGGNDIITSDNDVIKSENGDGELDLRYGANNNIRLSISGGDEYLTITPGYTELFSRDYIGIYTDTSGNDTSNDFVGHYLISNSPKYSRVGFQVQSTDYISKFGARGGSSTFDGFNIYAGAVDDQIITPINGGGNTIISSRDTTLNTGLTNTVVLGGNGITATNSNTVYVPTLNITNIGTGTSINNLGVDSNGNVVVGSVGATKYTLTTGFTGSVTQTINHGLDSNYIHVTVWDNSTGDLIYGNVSRVDSNNVDITLSVTGTYDIFISK
jgi:hypothetical protein